MTPPTESAFDVARAEIIDALERAAGPSMPPISPESIRAVLERAERLSQVEAQLARARGTLRLFREQVALARDCSSSPARPQGAATAARIDTTTPGEGIGVWRVGARVQRDPSPIAGGLEITRVRAHGALMTIEAACTLEFTGRPVGHRLLMQGRPGTAFVDAVFMGPLDALAISNTPEPAIPLELRQPAR